LKTVAFIGLGTIGRLMAANLEKAGFALRSYDLNGSGNCKSGAEAAEGADVLVTMLPDGKAVRKAVLAAAAKLKKGAIVVDMSSCDPLDTRELAMKLSERGIPLVDAPVSGAKTGARDARLCIMAGGDKRSFDEVRPLLEKLGDKIFHVGPVGAGHAIKALNNYIGASGTIAAFEALLIGRAFGLDAALMVEVFNASTGCNSTTQRKIPQQVLTKQFASGFSAALMTKDVGIAARLAHSKRVPAKYLGTTLKIWKAALANLPKGADHTEMYKYLESTRRT